MEDRSLLVSAIIVISLLMLVFFVPDEQGEPRELRKARPYVSIQVSIPLPNTEYAFKVKENYKNAEKAIWQVNKIQEHIDTVMLPTVELKKTNLGKYYITGYTAWELGGSTATASGATCHKASSYEDSFFNPTTCAIDPSLHNFSDLFYIEQFAFIHQALHPVTDQVGIHRLPREMTFSIFEVRFEVTQAPFVIAYGKI